MCGIAGYTGHRDAYPILLNALQRVEYRGYDSCGIAIWTDDSIAVLKGTSFVDQLRAQSQPVKGSHGIGHTRWATVGSPTTANAHPHLDCSGSIAIVHNGEIENYAVLRERLINQGHTFRSETDSEVLAHLVESHRGQGEAGAVAAALREVEGTYALATLQGDSDRLVMARRESPLVVGLGDGESFVASDVPALLENTREMVFLEDGDLALLSPGGLQVWNDEVSVARSVHHITWDTRHLDRAGYEHFFLKEVHEQPRVIRDTLSGRVSSTEPGVTLDVDLSGRPRPESILLSGCGTAYHACLIGEQFFQGLFPGHVRARVASELVTPAPSGGHSWAVLLSQSGETADTIGAARDAMQSGYFTMAITAGEDSSITRVVDEVLYMRTGPEISVGASKTFIAQLVDLYLLGLYLYPLPTTLLHSLLTELRLLPSKVQRVLGAEGQLQRIAGTISHTEHVFLIGKSLNHPVALEGAFKLKELAYLHAEGLPAGELKHGPIAMLTGETPVIAVIPRDRSYPRLLTAVKEIKARGAPVIALTDARDTVLDQVVDQVVHLPATDPSFSPVLNTVALQLLAYHTALERGCPIDRPRNLAKSVTVH